MAKITKLPKKDIKYNEKLMDEYSRMGWVDGWDTGNQVENFKTLLKLPRLAGVPLKNSSVLDVGSGTGDLAPILRKKGVSWYVGVDIYKKALEKARKEYKSEIFLEGDILAGLVDDHAFTFAFCSGGLTDKLSIDNYDYLESMVTKMWELTTVGIAFNFLTDEDEDPDPDLFFYNISRVLDICEDIDKNAKLEFEKSRHVAQAHVFMWR